MKNKIFSRKYLLSLFLTVPLTLALFVIVYSSYTAVDSRNVMKKNTAHIVSRGLLDKIDRNFYERFGDVQAFAYNKLAVLALQSDSSSDELQKFMNTMTNYYVLYDLMMLCDKQGRIIAVNTVDKTGKKINSEMILGSNVSNEEWFKTCMTAEGPKGGAWYSDFMIDQNVKSIDNDNGIGWGMAFAAPVRDGNGSPIGVWYNFASWYEVTIKIRQQAENELRISEKGALLLITDEKGNVIDAEDSSMIQNGVSLSEEALLNDHPIPYGKTVLHPLDYEYDWAVSEGAYTYPGKKWRSLVLIPKETFSVATFFSNSQIKLYVIVFLFLLAASFLAIRFSKRVTSSLCGLKSVVDNVSKGELVESGLVTNDELGDMAKSVNALVGSLRSKVEFAERIGSGILQTDFQPVGENDVLGISLVNMRDSLAKASDADDKRNWITEGLAKFANLLRASADIQSLYDHMISNLVKYMGANQGAIFVLEGDKNNAHYLELVSCYAYDRKKYLHKTFVLGEGLAGQAVLEKDYIYITDLPDSYIHISSGLGDARPSCILVMPLILNDEVLGVVELAFFHQIPVHYIEFMQKLAENIASVISSAKVNSETRRLLEQSQQMAEEMRAQEEEMRQNMEELQATQEEMHRKTEELQRIIEEERATFAIELSKFK